MDNKSGLHGASPAVVTIAQLKICLSALPLVLGVLSCRHPVGLVQAPKTNPVGSGWVDLRPRMELRIENGYYREGEPKRGIANFLGTEIAHYQVRTNRGLRLLSVQSAVAKRPRDQPGVRELIRPSQGNYRKYRYFYAVVFNKRGGIRGSVLLGAGSTEELDRLGAQLMEDPDLICGGESKQCTVFPEACTVAVEMEIEVNGVARLVAWGGGTGECGEGRGEG
jgi:hypothetical protein